MLFQKKERNKLVKNYEEGRILNYDNVSIGLLNFTVDFIRKKRNRKR